MIPDHILASCPLYHLPKGTLDLAALDNNTRPGSKEKHSTSDDTNSAHPKKTKCIVLVRFQ